MLFLTHALLDAHTTLLVHLVALDPTPTPGPPVIPAPITDQTGVNGALVGLARLGAGFLGGTLALILTLQGYELLMAEDGTRGVHVKKMISTLLGAVILILSAVTLAPQLVNTILGK